MTIKHSGVSTPLSPSTTLSVPPSPKLKDASSPSISFFQNPMIPASDIIEFISSRANKSAAVYIYDLAEQAGFGIRTKALAATDAQTAPIFSLQTRAGAGLNLIGRLSGSTSKDYSSSSAITAYTSSTGLALMAPSLLHLPPPTSSNRLVLQVHNLSSFGENFTFSPSIASLASVLPVFPESLAILASSTPQQAADFAELTYRITSHHVVHLFDLYSHAREIGHTITPLPETKLGRGSLIESIKAAGYNCFDYHGDPSAHTAIVAINGPLAQAAISLTAGVPGVAVISVALLRPWDVDAFYALLPASVNNIHVLDDVVNPIGHGYLHSEVLSSVLETNLDIMVHLHGVTPSQVQAYIADSTNFSKFLSSFIANLPTVERPRANSKKLMFLSTPKSSMSSLPRLVVSTFLSTAAVSPRLIVDNDIFFKVGGITRARLLLSPGRESKDLSPITEGDNDFLYILDQDLLKSHSVLDAVKPGGLVGVVTIWSAAEVVSNVPPQTLSDILERGIHLYTINAKEISTPFAGNDASLRGLVENVVAYLTFWRIYLGVAATESAVYKIVQSTCGDYIQGIELRKIIAQAWEAFVEVELPASLKGDVGTPTTLSKFSFTATSLDGDLPDSTPQYRSKVSSWHDGAKHLLFPGAFEPDPVPNSKAYPALRPEIPDETYLVTCTVNRRLTPIEYDRNVFHLEFDTSGTGLKYEIGEALGIHGWNDESEVLDFCKWYGVNPSNLITIPIGGEDSRMHTRTIFQALQQQIDLFGRPAKSFYTELAAHATGSVDRHALLFIGSPEGSSTFKKLAEKDTVTFVDVLKLYPSARPKIEVLCEMIGDIKPRHYSIASAQSVVGDRVDLLVVTVDWVTPSGSPRYGQCTRYLAGLKVGQKVTVSIKPSVMKLPPDDKQPLIMAGLGTGAAPFRAFLQHRAWLASQGKEVGPVYYYFGSRHQHQEYLYGEEIEAFIQDKIITRAGLAFSRDGPKKVYIQHKMREDSENLARMLSDELGVFYLCGPTWPVPDVYEALVSALVKYKGHDPVAAGEFLEALKEEERYGLEVY